MEKQQASYMEMCFHVDGGENLYLRIPTVWDDMQKKWRGFIKTPITKTLIYGEGKNSFELQNSMNAVMQKHIESSYELADEIFCMFMPAFYFEH